MIEVFDRERDRQIAYQERVGRAWDNRHNLVFTTPIGTPMDPGNYRRDVKALGQQAGISDLRTHTLRHSAGSFLFAMGVPTKTISEVLGHSTTRVTEEVYIHVQAEARAEIAKVMESVLWS